MTISARIEKDSIAPSGARLTTFVLTYPRFIHSELMTHRAFSRNASSSRAIPFRKQLEMIKRDMAMPLLFRENQAGMQAGEALPAWKQKLCRGVWRAAGLVAILFAKALDMLGAHKQYVNRIVEPFAHISVVLSGTDEAYANFFALRDHPAAQPEIQELAKNMLALYLTSEPNQLKAGEWHLPFVNTHHTTDLNWPLLIRLSVARCARVSYNNHDGTVPTHNKDIELYIKLLGSRPLHASPAEHQAEALTEQDKSGNFVGWRQYRKTLPDEVVSSMAEFLAIKDQARSAK